MLAPCIDSPLCQEQLIEACKMVAAAVEKIVIAAQEACGDDDALRDLGAAATAVTEALNNLIEQIREGVYAVEGSKCCVCGVCGCGCVGVGVWGGVVWCVSVGVCLCVCGWVWVGVDVYCKRSGCSA